MGPGLVVPRKPPVRLGVEPTGGSNTSQSRCYNGTLPPPPPHPQPCRKGPQRPLGRDAAVTCPSHHGCRRRRRCHWSISSEGYGCGRKRQSQGLAGQGTQRCPANAHCRYASARGSHATPPSLCRGGHQAKGVLQNQLASMRNPNPPTPTPFPKGQCRPTLRCPMKPFS